MTDKHNIQNPIVFFDVTIGNTVKFLIFQKFLKKCVYK